MTFENETPSPDEPGTPEPEGNPIDQGTPQDQPADDLLDPALYGDFRVPVKVNGQDTYVPLKDMTSGFMMQSDYTQKTQQIAAERERLAQADRLMQAMEADPAGTLRALQEAYQAGSGGEGFDDDFDELSPEEQRLAQLESWKATQEQRELDTWIGQQVDSLKTAHGDFDETELYDYMLSHSIKDFGVAHAAMSFQKQQRQQTLDRQAGDAKRQLPPVAGGHGVNAGALSQGTSTGPPNDMRAAAEAAIRELNL